MSDNQRRKKKDGEEVKYDEPKQHTTCPDASSQSIGTKDSMVAEPISIYHSENRIRSSIHSI